MRPMTSRPLCAIALAALGAAAAMAEDGPAREVTLDIDRDGAMDRAVLVETESGFTDLSIYLGAGEGTLDPSRQPTVVKKDMTDGSVNSGLEVKSNGSLIVTYGCGGCSNDYEYAIAIVHRHGEFLVAGYTIDWDTRNGIGSCDINFLTGKGFVSEGLEGKRKPLKGQFTPVKLAGWSEEKEPEACGF
jgi:hypothetical protein